MNNDTNEWSNDSNNKISRRLFLQFILALPISITASKLAIFSQLSENAETLLICLSEFDVTEGAEIDDLLYVSEFRKEVFKNAITELKQNNFISIKNNPQKRILLNQSLWEKLADFLV